ncbi:MAG TPA: MFS transporter, partial [Candidatus Limosilactobacillus merdipullorum]|nr:MFS transporter [Candidatus Limosilactobacillus merdipullorum]
IAQAFHVPATSLGILTTIPLICFGLFSVTVNWLSSRIGNEMAINWALVLLFVGCILRVVSYPLLILGTVLIGIAITFINVLLPPIISENLPNQIGGMTSLYNVALSLSSAIGAYAITPVTAGFGWKLSVNVLALIPLITWVLWLPNIKFNHVDANQSQQGVNMWHNPRAWALLVYFGASSFVFYTVVAWLPSIAESAGISHNSASLIAGLFQLFSIPAAFLAPLLATRATDRRPLVFGLGVLSFIGVAMMLLPIGSFTYYVIISLFLGLGIAGTFAFIMTTFGLKTNNPADTSSLSGMVQSLGYLIAAIGPVVIGKCKALFGNWTVSELITLVVIIIFVATGLFAENKDKIY